MGLFDIFLGKDPTEYWPQANVFQPVLDLRTMSLNTIRLGDPENSVKCLGKPDNPRPAKSGRYWYVRSGAEVEIGGNAVDYFAVILAPEGNFFPKENLQPTTARLVRADGNGMELSCRTQIAELRSFLGASPVTEPDDSEILDTYTLGEFILEAEAKLDGTLKRVNLFRA